MKYQEIIKRLESSGSTKAVEGMKRFGITPRKAGVSMPVLRVMAKKIGTDHGLAGRL